jgi:hypothetical protein
MNEAAPDIFLSYSREDLAVALAYRDPFVERDLRRLTERRLSTHR